MGEVSRPSLRALAAIYLKAGNTTFGGGDPTMWVLKRELGERRGWLSDQQFGIAYSLARITPGTNILAFCAGSAYLLHGWLAAAIAVTASSAPSALLSVWLTVVFESSSRNPVTRAGTSAVIAAVVGMMASSALQLVRPDLTRSGWLRIVILTGGTLLLREAFDWSPLQILGFAALFGAVWTEPDKP